MTASDIDALGARAESLVNQLALISAEPERLVRLFLTPEHRRAADLVTTWMRAAGMQVSEDALGTVRGSWGQGGHRLLIGSHIDTVIDAGKYDGPFGVIAGIVAVEHLAQAGTRLPFSIDVLAFGDEEGSRFPSTLASSSAIAGVLDRDTLGLLDREGVSLREAIIAYGKSPTDIAACALPREEIAGYVEVHIEQGPVLEALNQPLGVVTAIAGQTYLNVEIIGEAGHAGTVPMKFRRDALAGAAEMMLRVEALARDSGGEVLATVGQLVAKPGASNVIPGHVVFTVDLRSASDATRQRRAENMQLAMREVAERRRLGLTVSATREVATTPCNAKLQDGIAAAIGALRDGQGLAPRLVSGAGHDGQAMAKLCPIAMMFVRCRGGISHNPLEYAAPRDLGLAIAALIGFIENFAG